VQPVSIYRIWQKSLIATVFALDEHFRWSRAKKNGSHDKQAEVSEAQVSMRQGSEVKS